MGSWRCCCSGASTIMRSWWCSSSCLAASAGLGTCQVSMLVTAASSATKAATLVLNWRGRELRQVMRTCGRQHDSTAAGGGQRSSRGEAAR